MFTGLIEEQGKILSIKISDSGADIKIGCEKILEDVRIGASICVNGACLTVTNFGKDYIEVQASKETLSVSTFSKIKKGDKVNLERALTLSKRIDGHIVSGHIDCIAKFLYKKQEGFSQRFFFEINKNFSKYIIYKGSITINGVSLTVASVYENVFSAELIPLTLREVNLSELTPGNDVNIECDIFAKYIEKISASKDNKSNITYGFLAENGFV